ncbi:MAG: hypothetical protein A2X49_06840 [Lentisphaerae bacterium GWF2_52_8]|nr:MAG: hypothetical protein A2X49_06840 [Lentisphaerae bacterium GWF2_52_8]
MVLSDSTGGAVSPESCLSRLKSQEKTLEKSLGDGEIVLWFDACLYDQLILARHLDFFAKATEKNAKVSLVCIGEFPGRSRFTGLGELAPQELASLWPLRKEISHEELNTGEYIWGAFRSINPKNLLYLYENREKLCPLPFMPAAVLRLLEELPSSFNGLSRLERQSLASLSSGPLQLPELFEKVSAMEERPFFGDTQFWRCLLDLAEAKNPLLSISGPGTLPLWNPAPHSWGEWNASITPCGEAVLLGHKNHVMLNGIDRWLGGTHLCEENLWLWDSEEKRLQYEGEDDF